MALNKWTIVASDIESLDKTSYGSVDVVTFKALPNDAKINSTIVDNFVFVTMKDGTELVEVEDGAIDNVASVGKFAVNTTNVIKALVAKDAYATINEAKDAFTDTAVEYTLKENLTYKGDSWNLKVYDGLGNLIADYIPISIENAITKMKTLTLDREINVVGTIRFVLEPITSEV